MVEYTNDHGFPDYVVQWLLNDEYDYIPGTISATGLMRPVQARILQERHDVDTVIDVSTLIAARYGTAIHASFEAVDFNGLSDPGKYTIEQRYFTDAFDIKLTGKPDMIVRVGDKGSNLYALKDLKSTSVWSYVLGGERKLKDYTLQLSIYRYILSKNDIKVMDTAEILFVFTDWKRSDAKKQPDKYPQTRLAIKKIDLLSIEDTEKYIIYRLDLLKTARGDGDEDLPECTDEELWKDNDKYAHWNRGNKKATKVYDDEMECRAAVDVAIDKGKDAYLEIRKGMVKRCPDYCPVHPFCSQYKKLQAEGVIVNGE